MKELTIEEKAQRYDEAIEKFEVVLNLNTVKESGTIFADDVRKILPELKESEDDVMRKVLINIVKGACSKYGIKYQGEKISEDKLLSWLEKQGEKSVDKLKVSDELYEHIRNTCACIDDALSSETLVDVTDYLSMAEHSAQSAFDMIEKQREQKLIIEGTFVNVDEVRENFMQEVYRILNADQTNDRANQIIEVFDNLPTVELEKQGEQNPTDYPLAHEKMETERWGQACKAACCDRNYRSHHGLTETRDDYFVDGVHWADEHPKQKPAWSEEDEIEFNHILKTLTSVAKEQEIKGYNNLISSINWFKSLKERVQPQTKQEWKPSDGQIQALEFIVHFHTFATKDTKEEMEALLNDIKKLREE